MNCKHCGHSLIFLNGYWRHYHKKQGAERYGTARIECFSCECKDPERYEIKPIKINWRHKDGSYY